MMKYIFSLCIVFIILIMNLSLTTSDTCAIIQNKPGIVGETITFTLDCGTSGTPNVAWDFGDGGGFGKYKVSLTTTHTYYTPGVYRVFARIQGEDIPVSIVQTIVRPISTPAPTHSSTIVMDAAKHTVWTVNVDNNSITCIDADQLTKTMEVTVGKNPRTVALDKDGNVWVANEGDATISVVNPAGNMIKSVKLPFASRPYGICFNPAGTKVYVTLQATNKLLKLDLNGKITGEISVGRNPRGIAISSNGSRLFVTRYVSPVDQGEITEVNPVSMTKQQVITMPFDTTADFDDRGRGVPNFISSLTISPDGKTVWVPCKKDNTARGLFRDGLPLTFDNTVRTIVSQIDLSTNKENVPFRRDINDSDLACAVEFSPYGNIAFVALQGNNKIQAIDVYTNARIGSLNSTGLGPQGMVFTADGYKLFVHNFMSRTVRVFNTRDIILSNAFEERELTTISTVTNEKLSPQVFLGKKIFYNSEDTRMSKTGYISCGSCHNDGLSDERVWDFTDRGEGFRNTHSMLGRKGTGMGNVHWTANFDEIQDFENDMRNGFGGSGFLSDAVFNSGTTSDPLGDKKTGLNPELDALAAYVSSLDAVHASPYRNQDGSLTADAEAGKKIFTKLGCNSCHGGPDFTDRTKQGVFYDVGTILPSSGKRRNQPLTGFATPTLKGIWETAPYLHDGSAETLKDVLTVKNPTGKHGNTASLTTVELNELIAFLQQIDESKDVINGIEQFVNDDTHLAVFPNPASEYVTINYEVSSLQPRINCLIQISNSLGQVVYSHDITSTSKVASISVPVKNFMPGIYIVTLLDGNAKTNTKLIIE